MASSLLLCLQSVESTVYSVAQAKNPDVTYSFFFLPPFLPFSLSHDPSYNSDCSSFKTYLMSLKFPLAYHHSRDNKPGKAG